MTTYAKRPAQSSRLEQPAQKRHSTPTARSIGPTSNGDVPMETTFSPSGAMVPAIRLSRAEQAAGSAGKSSERQAVSKTSVAAAAAGIGTSSMSDVGHTAAPVPQRSSSPDSCILNANSSKPSAFTEINWWGFGAVLSVALYMAAFVWLLSVIFGPA